MKRRNSMQLNKDDNIRQLPLSHTLYRDDEIDASKAERLVVYHYPLLKSYRWQEWVDHLDSQLSYQYYPYLMRNYNERFGLFVALDSTDDEPPVIKNSDGIHLSPERIRYTPEMNPVWIRLIMRKAVAFGNHCRGSHTKGQPLLKIDVWQGKKSTGINAMSLDCRTQQLADQKTTEVVLSYENVPLRPLKPEEDVLKCRSPLWIYGEKNVLMRWIPTKGNQPSRTIYKTIPKNKNRRQNRPFLDLSSVEALEKSRCYILKSVQQELIKQAAEFGFDLEPKVLNLKSLLTQTKYKSNSSTQSVITSIPLNTKVDVLDMRMSKAIPASEIVSRIQQALDNKKLGTQLSLLPDIEPHDLSKLEVQNQQRILILIDQLKGIVDDRYPLTETLRTQVACQHINVNPHDLSSDSVEAGLLVEQTDDNDETILIPEVDSKYYEYDLSQFDTKLCQEELTRKAEIVIKELELKYLLLNQDAKISTSLPQQKDLLTESLIVITDGYLFTVKNDRPVMLPFNSLNSNCVRDCNEVLNSFNTSVQSLLTLLNEKWPYNYKPKVVMEGCNSSPEKLTKFLRKLTIVIHKSETVSIYFQDPQYETPYMIPLHLEEMRKTLNSQNHLKFPIERWQLPPQEKMMKEVEQLTEEGELTVSKKKGLLQELDTLIHCWYKTLKEMCDEGSTVVDYQEIKKDFSRRLLEIRNARLKPDEKPKSRNPSNLISSWTTLLSRVFELPLGDVRQWLREVPGIQKLWHDPEQGYYVVGGLAPLKKQLQRQPSIRQWHALQGELDTNLLTKLLDVDWVRINQLAGNPCVATLVKRWRECQSNPDEADAPLKY